MVTATVQMAEKHPNVVVGVVSQQRLLSNRGQLHFTPGEMDHVIICCVSSPVHPEGVCMSGVTTDGKGQQYRTPDHVISSCGSDIIIVGRGIYEVIIIINVLV